MNQLQKNLLYLIAKHETNPTALAAASGVKQPTLHRILTGESSDPRTSNVEKLANHFNISVEFLRTANVEGFDSLLRPQDAAEEDTTESPGHRTVDVKQTKPTGRSLAQINVDALREFQQTLPQNLRDNVERREVFQGNRYLFDYSSDKVVAEMFALPEDGNMHLLYAVASRRLWRLSTHRLLTKDIFPERDYFLFVVFPSGAADKGFKPFYALPRTITEAALHGINVVFASPPDAAQCVIDVEEGRAKALDTGEYFDDDLR